MDERIESWTLEGRGRTDWIAGVDVDEQRGVVLLSQPEREVVGRIVHWTTSI